MIYLKLFLSFLQIGLFSFGGGYAAMPLIREQVVTQHGWLTMTEFTDLITISQMTPGPIAINAATFVGSKIAGVPGSGRRQPPTPRMGHGQGRESHPRHHEAETSGPLRRDGEGLPASLAGYTA